MINYRIYLLLMFCFSLSQFSQADEMSPGTTFQDCEECPVMMVLPAGEFLMGSRENYKYQHPNQLPPRRISISYSFAVGQFEITEKEFFQCFLEKGCSYFSGNYKHPHFLKDVHPVGNVSWEDAKEYLAWISAKTGRKYRLLSESEWEYAARGGTDTQFWWGNDVLKDLNGEYAICKGCNIPKVFVGAPPITDRLIANPFGLFNMNGSLVEWVEDCQGEFTDIPDDGKPFEEDEACRFRMRRGGSWFTQVKDTTSNARLTSTATGRLNDSGFRIATDQIELR